jgi:hypothetical protein
MADQNGKVGPGEHPVALNGRCNGRIEGGKEPYRQLGKGHHRDLTSCFDKFKCRTSPWAKDNFLIFSGGVSLFQKIARIKGFDTVDRPE